MDAYFDYLVLGSGIAGLSAARVLCEHGSTAILTKKKIQDGSTQYAQGGVAVVIDPMDSIQSHFEDTIQAGHQFCHVEAVHTLVEEGPIRVHELIDLGCKFDQTNGHYHLSKEAAHTYRRILHSGDATGKEIERTLIRHLKHHPNIHFFSQTTVTQLIYDQEEILGCHAWVKSKQMTFRGKAVVLATGGCAQLYAHNTNPPVATGDGIALAYDAGCAVQDMEFMQFHPTALWIGAGQKGSQFLISEAVRGEGGFLRNDKGHRFMQDYHQDAELAPRDIVARSIFFECQKTNAPHVWLDFSGISDVKQAFPTIYAQCQLAGIDLRNQWVPVSPAAHYFMGGVQTDLWGKTSLKRLYAIGEVASMGLHGANRLASNSLLEGLVFGHRAALHAQQMPPLQKSIPPSVLSNTVVNQQPASSLKKTLQKLMWQYAGIVRTESGLTELKNQLQKWHWLEHVSSQNVPYREIKNMWYLATLITDAALQRKESLGSHFRQDFPQERAGKKYRLVKTRGGSWTKAWF